MRTIHVESPEHVRLHADHIHGTRQTAILHVRRPATWLVYCDGHFVDVRTSHRAARQVLTPTTRWSWPLRAAASLLAGGARRLNRLAVALDHTIV